MLLTLHDVAAADAAAADQPAEGMAAAVAVAAAVAAVTAAAAAAAAEQWSASRSVCRGGSVSSQCTISSSSTLLHDLRVWCDSP